MKQICKVLVLAALLYGCGGGNEEAAKKENVPDTATKAVAITDNPDYQKGLALISNSDCLTCHKIKDPLVGPPYKEVALKYENTPENITMLAGKVIAGGSGVWGQLPMSPHPGLSTADAEQMVKYVLLLRNTPER